MGSFFRPVVNVVFCLSLLSGCQGLDDVDAYLPTELIAPIDVFPNLSIETWRQPGAGLSDYTGHRITGLILARLDRNRQDNPQSAERPPLTARLTFEDYQPYGAYGGTEFFFEDRLRISAVLDMIDPSTGTVLNSQIVARSLPLNRFHRHWSDLDHRQYSSHYGWLRHYRSGRAVTQMRLLERAFASAVTREIGAATLELAREPNSKKAKSP